MMLRYLTAVLLSMLAAARLFAQPSVEYTVKIDQPQTQIIEVEMSITGWDKPELEAHLPAWRPGKYAILDPAGSVREVWADGPTGQALHVEKFAKASWRVHVGEAKGVKLRYRLYANSLGDRTRHVDDTHAFLSGSTVFMYVPELRAAPVTVRMQTPKEWRTASGLDEAAPGTLTAPNYDVLVDSPIEAGLHERGEFSIGEVRFEVVVWGHTQWMTRPEGINLARLLGDTEKIARTQIDLFGGFPTKRYVFLIHVSSAASGGTEHLNSTICQARLDTFDSESTYQRFLGLIAHELFHTWNVKAFRPKELTPYDYDRENYTPLLWLAEGTTNYYDGLTPVRAGLSKTKDYIEHLGKLIRDEKERPGGSVQSVEASSYDAWIKFNKPSPDSINSTVSFYDRGELVNLALDLHIRKLTDGSRSLDDVMKELWRRFPDASKGYTTTDVLDIAGEIAGEPVTNFYYSYIRLPKWPPIEELLTTVGLEVFRDKGDDETRTAVAYLGLKLKDDPAGPVVTAVLSDGPCAAAVLADDQLIAIDGRRLNKAADLDARLKDWKPGTPVSLTLFRRDALHQIEVAPATRDPGTLKVRKVKEPTDAQKDHYRKWIGVAWDEK